jgi:hypothetical protein
MPPLPLVDLLCTASPPDGVFSAAARVLLDESALLVGGELLHPTSVEFYYRSPRHPDPFVHGHPLQQQMARRYFHREGSSYRGGTYKGVDITFGGPGCYGGILIRSLLLPDGRVIDGPSLCVDVLLGLSGFSAISTLDAAIGPRRIDDPTSPLRCVSRRSPIANRPLYATARVGLSSKRAACSPLCADYLARPYRYLNTPVSLKKGRRLLVTSLWERGLSVAEIAALTGSRARVIEGWLPQPRSPA